MRDEGEGMTILGLGAKGYKCLLLLPRRSPARTLRQAFVGAAATPSISISIPGWASVGTPMSERAGGFSVRNNGRRFHSIRLVNRVTPVTLPPGRLKLLTSPALTGSPPIPNTIGIIAVADFAASPEGSPPAATITATCRPTRSAASAGRPPQSPRAQREWTATLPPPP